MGVTLEQLIERLSGGYKALSAKQIRKRAENAVQSEYDEKERSARQAYETKDAALAEQLAGLTESYDRERSQRQASDQAAYSDTRRGIVNRGMQRSSYSQGLLANLLLSAAQAQQDITARQTADEKNVSDQRALLASQLADTLAGYSTGRAADVQKAIYQLQDREYDRSAASRSKQDALALKLYQLSQQAEKKKKSGGSSASAVSAQTKSSTRKSGSSLKGGAGTRSV